MYGEPAFSLAFDSPDYSTAYCTTDYKMIHYTPVLTASGRGG